MRSGKGPVSCAPLGDGRGSFLLQWRGKAGIMSIRKPAFRAAVRSIVPDGAEKRKRKGDAARSQCPCRPTAERARRRLLRIGTAEKGADKTMKPTLVIMAAGLASRYGGDKQTDGVGPHGERLMEYSVYDAVRAGFRKVVLILRPGAEEAMDRLLGDRLRAFRLPDGARVEVAYVFQDFTSLPEFYQVPPDRTKPYGTGHALLCAAEAVQDPFCVVNADDYYGPEAFQAMHSALVDLAPSGQAAMVAYVLKNTVPPQGTVSRGICRVRADGTLESVTERLRIGADGDGYRDETDGAVLDPEDIVSMNLWGFAPSFFPALRRHFEAFLRTADAKAECQLPTVVNEEMAAGRLSVRVLRSRAEWFGMTYREDRARVAERLRDLHQNGTYPPHLWGGSPSDNP